MQKKKKLQNNDGSPQERQQNKKKETNTTINKNEKEEKKNTSSFSFYSLYETIESIVIIIIAIILFFLFIIFMIYGGGRPFPEDRTSQPIYNSSSLEILANLSYPPGNIAVSMKTGRIFFTFHPEGGPLIKLAELQTSGKEVAFPSEQFQRNFTTVLSLRFDNETDYLWVLDFANHGYDLPKLFAFNVSDNRLVEEFEFPREIAGFGSMLNDFQIHAGKIYIADSSFFRKTPAIIIYDIKTRTAQRRLQNHVSVTPKKYDIRIEHLNKDMVIVGVFGIRPGVDSIAIDTKGEWLYYASVTDPVLYRVRTVHLNDKILSESDLESKVEIYANKTMSDGIVMDDSFIYITDMEHSAIVRLRLSENPQERTLQTLFKNDTLLRWPDGLSFGPSSSLYLTCSSLQDVFDTYTIWKSKAHISSQSPFNIFRFHK